MRITIRYDVNDLCFMLDKIIFEVLSEEQGYHYWHNGHRLSVYRLMLWWLSDRLDHVNGFPILHDGFVEVPFPLRIHLLNATQFLQTLLYRMVPFPTMSNAEWTSAQMELRNGDLVISMQGNKIHDTGL